MRINFKRALIFLAFFLVGLGGSLAFFTVRTTLNEVIVTTRPGATNAAATPTPTPDPLAPYGILLLGLRGDNSQGGFLTDTMILAYVQPHQKHISLISIPRDLWVQIPTGADTTQHFKINSAYVIGLDDRNYPNKPIEYTGGAAGGGTLAKHIVEEVLGIPVRYFVSLDFEGFKKSIDILGGVDVTITRALDDPYYPITGKETDSCEKTEEDIKKLMATLSGDLLEHEFPCRYEHLKFDKGVVHMDGETALKFARSRHALEDGTDFARSNRQKQIMLAVKDKVLQIGFLSKALPFIQSLSGDVRTDIPLDVMRSAITQVGEYKTYTVNSIALSTENALMQTYSADRQYILVGKSGIDNWQSVHDYISAEIAKLSPSPIPTASPN